MSQSHWCLARLAFGIRVTLAFALSVLLAAAIYFACEYFVNGVEWVGHRFNLGSDWSATVSARSHYFLGASQTSADYQEISASFAWLDRCAFTLASIPNAVRWYEYYRLGRSPAWVADAAGQWLIGPGLFVTGAAGYYYSSASSPDRRSGAGYAYGNLGLAYEQRQWRVELGYFLAQNRAQDFLPYPPANRHVAGTLSWRF